MTVLDGACPPGPTRKLREEFEQDRGEVGWISGDVNPADLGFHR